MSFPRRLELEACDEAREFDVDWLGPLRRRRRLGCVILGVGVLESARRLRRDVDESLEEAPGVGSAGVDLADE